MEEKIHVRTSLGSKLPKFGGAKPLGNFLQQAPNGTHSGLLAKANLAGKKHSDHDGTSAFSLNWRKLKCQNNDHMSRESPHPATEKRFLQSQMAAEKDSPRLGITTKTAKQSNMLVSHKEDLNENLSSSNKFTKGTQFGRTSYSGLNGCKTHVNGFYTNKPPAGLHRPRANSATSRNFPSTILSIDKPFSNVRRSQSFSHSVQTSLLPSAPMTRSHSFNREVNVTGPCQLQHIPIRTTLKQNMFPRTAKQYGLPNGNESHMKSSFTRTYSTSSSVGLQKPSLSNGLAVSVPLGYKMSRPSLNKPNRSQCPREFIIDGKKDSSVSQVTDKMESLSNGTKEQDKGDQDDLELDNSSCDLQEQNYKDSYCSEDVDELSISSLSSSDKNDFSEDFSDDFIDLEDWNNTIVVESEEKLPEQPSDCSLGKLQDQKQSNVNRSDEWIAKNEGEANNSPHGEISPDMDYRDPSSLELSPSDSSDGTYMWDEEGMEPIGNVHPCGSYESSEMNSLDILNNLDSGDLEDDDLMLDVDFPEDATCDMGKSENMSHFERTERNLRQQVFWKRSPPRLNGQEQYHLSNPDHYHNGRGSTYLESPTDHRKGYGSPSCYIQSPRSTQMMGLRENTVMLDEMTLCHMVQDCTTVKTQLLKLKRLLQQEDGPESPLQDIQLSVPATPEPQNTPTLWKTEDLLSEIHQLKEESKKKDETIKQLQQQLKTRCKCQEESAESRAEKPKQYDKYTQTPWRSSSPQILQCSISTPSSTDHTSGKLIAHRHAEVQNKPQEQIQHPFSCSHKGGPGVLSKVPENELSDLLSTRLKIDDANDHPKDIKEEEHCKSYGPLDDNKNLRPQEYTSDVLPHFPVDRKKDVNSKIIKSSTASVPVQIPRPKPLQFSKPKMRNTLAHQEITNSIISSNSCSNSKELQMLTATSNVSCVPSPDGLHTVIQKSQQPIQNDCSRQPPKQVHSDAISNHLDPLCSTVSRTQSSISMAGAKPLSANFSEFASKGKLPSESSLPTQSHVPAVEPSKPSSRLMPKGTMLRPPSNLTSKLKKPNGSTSDVPSPNVSSETQRSPVKSSFSVMPRPHTYKKDILHETVESSLPKRQSRLPQPKAH
ncbi:serine-rich coiled-coil domain-containing protein 2 isoform X2 [Mixophyes fleayi]|uniref:serine-rich coiled-coil domain-containing protein 2 isoform X2 n=1 Tax=Mixophyes fleayi TaxID=3061075 RepID=UPI003F4E3BC5